MVRWLSKKETVDRGEAVAEFIIFPRNFRGPPESPCCMRKSTLKNDRYCPLVMQGFSNC